MGDWLRSGSGGPWSPEMMGVADESAASDWGPSRYEAKLGYGWPEDVGRMRDVYASTQGGGWRGSEYRLGMQFVLGERLGWEVGVELFRQDRAIAEADHGVRLVITPTFKQLQALLNP